MGKSSPIRSGAYFPEWTDPPGTDRLNSLGKTQSRTPSPRSSGEESRALG